MLSPNHQHQLPHQQQTQGPQYASTAQHASLERAARSLINLGCDLFAKCDSAGSKVVVAAHEEAIAILDVSHSLITNTTSNERQAWELAAQHFQIGTELLWEANMASKQEGDREQVALAPDLYQEDECDVGPRILQAPIRADDDAHAHAAGQTTSTILLEAIILFNKGLIYQSMHSIAEARQLYEVVIYTVQTMFGAHATTSPPCSAAMMELAMRSYNNLGVINYAAAANDDERNEALTASSFETSIHFAKHLSECSKDYRLEYATVLSNWCRACWMRGDIAASSTSSSDKLYHRLREILRLRTRLLSWDHPDVAAARYNLAVAEYAHRRDGPKAVAQLRQYLAVAAAQQHGSSSSSTTTIDVLPALILLLLIQNEDKEDHASQDLVRGLRTLQEKRQDLGPHTMEVASVLNFVGTSLFHLQDYEHALIFFQEELRLEDNHKKHLLEEDCGPDESNSISVTCNNIGRILQELGRYPEAIDYYKRALKGECGDDHDDFQGVTHASIKDSSILAAADAAHSASSSASPSPSSTNSPNKSSTVNLFSTIWYNLGLIHDKLGAHNEAIIAFKMSLELRRAMFGPDHSDVACLLYNIGVLQMEQGRLDDASSSFREALRIRRVDAAGQLNDQHIIKTLEKLTSLHKAKGNIQRALEATREILAVQEVSLEYDEATRVKELGITLRSVAELHHDVNDLYKAVDTATESANKLRTAVEANLRHLQQQQQSAGTNGTSTGHLRELLLLERFSCVEQLASSLLLLGSLYHELGEPMEASQILREAALVVQQARAEDDEALAAVQCPPPTSAAAALRPSSLLALQEVTATLAICHCAAVA